jgi:tRNA pseudouridine55 synthase
MKTAEIHGILVVDKPAGLTSREVVDRVAGWFPPRTRLGHGGTLDPLATGVLVICAGRATRLIEYIQEMEKTYEAELLLGARSDTDDVDGRVEAVEVSRAPDQNDVAAGVGQFVGAMEQVPPRYSAARVAGRRAYDLARASREFALKPRRVVIHEIQLLFYQYPHLGLKVRCSKGTYIRSLARDLGERLGCGALIELLRRTAIGPLNLESAIPLDRDTASGQPQLLPLSASVAQLPNITLPPDLIRRLCQGQAVRPPTDLDQWCSTGELAVLDESGELLAIAAADSQGRLRPVKVLRIEK